jgi:GTP-binding protein
MSIKIALVGRPNVGKSTLFNRFVGKKKAIVYRIPGTTRDRNDCEVLWKGKRFIITDTAGWDTDVSLLSKHMFHQLSVAIEKSKLVLFVVDGRVGMHPLDAQIALYIRRIQKKTILVVNKIDTQLDEANGYDFCKLGFSDMIFVSASHRRNISDLLDKILNNTDGCDTGEKATRETLKIILVGKPNVGKSSLVNAVAKEERSIIDNIPGTTRDSITVQVFNNDKEYILVDTAGYSLGSSLKDDMKYLSTLSTDYAIEDADVVVLVADALQGIGETEAKIARILVDKNKPVVIAVNKWDLIEKREEYLKYFGKQLRERLKFMRWAGVVFISAKTGQRLGKVLQQAEFVFKQYSKELTYKELSDTVAYASSRKPYISKGKTLKFKKYAQVASRPPMFVFSINGAEPVHFSYKRFLENCFRERFNFCGTPIVLKFKNYYKN